MDVKSMVEGYRDELLERLGTLVSINSVEGEPQEDAPFGPEPKRALVTALGMLEKDAYCIDILNQVSAANSALNSFTKVLLAEHIKSCVAEDVKAGNEEKLDELVRTLQKLMK